MNNDTFHFRIGSLECIAISDGTFTYTPPMFPSPAIALFANAPNEHLVQALGEHGIQPDQWIEWTSTYVCLAIKTGDYVVLVDTGAGDLAPTTGKLEQNIKAANLLHEDIDIVITTHAHPDHIGGNTTTEGTIAFTNARFVMWKDEWDFWTSERAERELGEHMAVPLDTARKNLPPTEGQLELIDHETEIVPGISAIATPGHTPGHMALAISSGSDKLLILSDAVLHPIHLEQPDWYSVFDHDLEQAVSSRRQLLNEAVVEKALVFAFHFPFPCLGRVVQRGKAWQWLPVQPSI